jgi:SAM-dependent methyltransferase
MNPELENIFSELISRIPTSLAVRESMRLSALLKCLPPEGSVLDIGCGDGSFWQSYPRRSGLVIDGVDLNQYEVELARNSGIYRNLWQSDISKIRPTETYDIALGNCSMEHIPGINQALQNIRTCLKPDGRLLMFVPAFGWTRTLKFVQWTNLIGTRAGMAASGALDGFFQHHHLYDETSWCLLVRHAGFKIESCRGLGSVQINRHFERNLATGFGEFLFKSIFRKYPPSFGQRRKPPQAFWQELENQPTDVADPSVVEYLIEAVPV